MPALRTPKMARLTIDRRDDLRDKPSQHCDGLLNGTAGSGVTRRATAGSIKRSESREMLTNGRCAPCCQPISGKSSSVCWASELRRVPHSTDVPRY